MKKTLLIAAICCLSIAFFYSRFSCKKPDIVENHIIVGTNAQFPPYEFWKNSELVGFDVDLMNEIGFRLDKKIVFKDVAFDSLLLEIQAGSVEVIASAMNPTFERSKKVNFTQTYLESDPLVIITLAENPLEKIDDLFGKNVTVNDGYTSEIYMKSKSDLYGIYLNRLPTPAEALLDLMHKKSFAFVSSFNSIKPFLDQYGIGNFSLLVLEQKETYALAVSRCHPSLFESLQKVLDEMKHDGSLEKLKIKWQLL